MQDAVKDAEPVPFLAVRFLAGAAMLVPLLLRRPPRRAAPGLWPAGAACAAALLSGYLFQTIGLQYTTSSVSAFVTYLLVVLVPLISAVTLRRVPAPPTLAGVVLATIGLGLLTGGVSGVGKGEVLTLGC